MEIDQYSARILKHQNLLEERYCNLTVRERDARIKECHLRKREECLKAQQQRLLLEQKAIPQLKKTSSSDIEDKKTAYTTNDACENTQYKEFIANLEIENKALQTINTEQRIRIDELTERSSLLLRDLESTQAVVNILSGNGMSRNPTLTSAALLAPTSFNLTTSIEGLVLNGGGENGSKLLPSEYSGEYRNDVKRRMIPSKKSSILSTSTSDEGTSGILGEARDKLRQLEVESEEVDRHYQHFKLKRAQHGFPFQPQFGCKQNGISLSKLQEFDNNSSYDEHKRAEISTTFNRVVSSSVLMEHNPLKEQADQQTNDRLKSNLSKPETRNIHSQKRTIKDISNTSSDLDYIFGTGTSGVSMSQVDSTNEKSVSRISSN
ncbi:hypothetical protein FQA39_LY17246 [Lamprigera yunnana]|nr:hypothetical protein FQA39_LY17246 [Lamprigera yunnana]